MGQKLGLQGILYYNTGSYATPTWTRVPLVADVDLPLEYDEADMTNRDSGGVEMIVPTVLKAPIEGELIWDGADANILALRDAHIDKTLTEFAVADGAIATSGTVYWRGHYYILRFGRGEKLREGMRVPFMAKPGFSSNANPAWVDVA